MTPPRLGQGVGHEHSTEASPPKTTTLNLSSQPSNTTWPEELAWGRAQHARNACLIIICLCPGIVRRQLWGSRSVRVPVTFRSHFLSSTTGLWHFRLRVSWHMATVKDFLADVTHLQAWARAQATAGVDMSAVASCQLEAVLHKLRLLRNVTYEGGTELCTWVTESDIGWTDVQKKELVTEIGKLVGSNSVAGVSTRRPTQECATFELYLTAADHARLDDINCSQHALIGICKQRAAAIGLLRADEPTKGRIAFLVKLKMRKPDMEPKVFYKLIADVRASFLPSGCSHGTRKPC